MWGRMVAAWMRRAAPCRAAGRAGSRAGRPLLECPAPPLQAVPVTPPGEPSAPTPVPGSAADQPATGTIRHPRCPPAQPEEPGPGHPHRRDDGGDRAQRLGQEQPGVRHAVCRGPAAVCRDLQRLRAPVPRPHGPACRRPGRRRAAGHRHRPDQPGAHLAFHGRHDDRAERPPEAAVRPRRPAVRQADRAAGAARHAGDDLRRPAGESRRGGQPPARAHLPGGTASHGDASRSRAMAVGQRLHPGAGPSAPWAIGSCSMWWPTGCVPLVPTRSAWSRPSRPRSSAAAAASMSTPWARPTRTRSCGRYSTGLHCPESDLRYADPQPALFSFNSAFGACEACRGFGRVIGVDMGLGDPRPPQDPAQRRHQAPADARLEGVPGRPAEVRRRGRHPARHGLEASSAKPSATG